MIASLQRHRVNLSYQILTSTVSLVSVCIRFCSFGKVVLKMIGIPVGHKVTLEGNHKNLRFCRVLLVFQKVSQ